MTVLYVNPKLASFEVFANVCIIKKIFKIYRPTYMPTLWYPNFILILFVCWYSIFFLNNFSLTLLVLLILLCDFVIFIKLFPKQFTRFRLIILVVTLYFKVQFWPLTNH